MPNNLCKRELARNRLDIPFVPKEDWYTEGMWADNLLGHEFRKTDETECQIPEDKTECTFNA